MTPSAHGPEDRHRNPLLAVLGVGDAAVAAVQQRVAELPAELDELRVRFSGDELRRALVASRAQLDRAYSEFAGRGEEAWGRLREQPQVRQAITTLESYTEKLDARVDGLVDDAQGAANRAFAAAGRQTRTTGERVAQAGQRWSGRAADAVVDASAATAGAVEEVGANAAEVIEEAGDESAATTRKATRARPRTPSPRKTPRDSPRDSGPASE